MWNTISDAIVAKIQTSNLVDSTAVYDYRKSRFDTYPAITVYAADNQGTSFADTQRNRRSYVFSIRCYQERLDKGESGAEEVMRNLIDDLIRIFDADAYLNSAIQGKGFVHPVPSSWALVQGEGIDVLMAEVLLEAEVIV